jgi:hypothetical protein
MALQIFRYFTVCVSQVMVFLDFKPCNVELFATFPWNVLSLNLRRPNRGFVYCVHYTAICELNTSLLFPYLLMKKGHIFHYSCCWNSFFFLPFFLSFFFWARHFLSFGQFTLFSCNSRSWAGADTATKYFHQMSLIFESGVPCKEERNCNLEKRWCWSFLRDYTFLKVWGLLFLRISFFLLKFADHLKPANLKENLRVGYWGTSI